MATDYALMLNSGNDCAVAIACLGGSVDGFVQQMNKKAYEVGAVNTHLTTQWCGSQPLQHGSGHGADCRLCHENDSFRNIVSTKTQTIERSDPKPRLSLQFNKMLEL